MSSNIKLVREEDRIRLQKLKTNDTVRELADVDGSLSYADVLRVILPEATEETILERPHEDMKTISIYDDEVFQRLSDLAGDGVPAHEVVNYYADQFEDNYE